MVRSSYSDVFQIAHEREMDEHIAAGDLVRTGPNAFPHFRVIAIYGEKVWVRDVQYGSDGITSLSLCRKINGAMTSEPNAGEPSNSLFQGTR